MSQIPKLPSFTEATYLKPDVLVYKKSEIDELWARVFKGAVEVVSHAAYNGWFPLIERYPCDFTIQTGQKKALLINKIVTKNLSELMRRFC